MKRYLYFFLAILASGFVQVSLLDYFRVFGIKPDLCLIMAVVAALSFRPKWAFAFGIFAGFLKDIFALGGFGINAIAFSLWVFLIIELNRRLPLDYELIQLGVISIVSLLNNVLSAIFAIYSGKVIPPGIYFGIVLLASAYTAFVYVPVSRIVKPIINLTQT